MHHATGNISQEDPHLIFHNCKKTHFSDSKPFDTSKLCSLDSPALFGKYCLYTPQVAPNIKLDYCTLPLQNNELFGGFFLKFSGEIKSAALRNFSDQIQVGRSSSKSRSRPSSLTKSGYERTNNRHEHDLQDFAQLFCIFSSSGAQYEFRGLHLATPKTTFACCEGFLLKSGNISQEDLHLIFHNYNKNFVSMPPSRLIPLCSALWTLPLKWRPI